MLFIMAHKAGETLKKILFLSALLILLTQAFVFAGQYNVYTPTTYKQIEIVQSPKNAKIQGQAIELLVDYSGSMDKWIEIAKETLIYILPKIPDTSAVALRVFGEYNSLTSSFAYTDSCKATRLAVYFKKNNEAKLIDALQKAKTGGSTPLEFALRETVNKDLKGVQIFTADNKAAPVQRKKIILVTDGYDTCNGDPCAYIRSIVKSRPDIQIDVVQLGSDNTLKCLTNQTNGKFYKINGSRQKFETAFEDAFNVPRGTVSSGKQGLQALPSSNVKIKYEQPAKNNTQPAVQIQTSSPKRGYKFIQF